MSTPAEAAGLAGDLARTVEALQCACGSGFRSVSGRKAHEKTCPQALEAASAALLAKEAEPPPLPPPEKRERWVVTKPGEVFFSNFRGIAPQGKVFDKQHYSPEDWKHLFDRKRCCALGLERQE